jgi:hypothetical protein
MYSDEERQIFRYKNGTTDAEGRLRLICGDPLELDRKFLAACIEEELQTYIDRLARVLGDSETVAHVAETEEIGNPHSEVKLVADTIGQIVPIVRRVFNISPLSESGDGLTEAETLVVLTDFINSKSDVKKIPRICRIHRNPRLAPSRLRYPWVPGRSRRNRTRLEHRRK